MPISFLPQDTITPAIQNLGQNLQQITALKMADQDKQIAQFKQLVAVSMEGVRSNHRDEILRDSEKFRQEAADKFIKAEQENREPNYKDVLDIEQKKNVILSKVAKSQLLEQAYQQAMNKAMVLQANNKLDPTSMDALDKWATNIESVDKTNDPRLLIKEQYTPVEALKITRDYFKDRRDRAMKTQTLSTDEAGNYHMIKGVYTEAEVKRDAEQLWQTDPMLQKAYKGDMNGFVNDAQASESVKGTESMKYKPIGSRTNTAGWTTTDNGDGSTLYTPQQAQTRQINYGNGDVAKTTLLNFTEDENGHRIWSGVRETVVPDGGANQALKDKGYPADWEVQQGLKKPAKTKSKADPGYYKTKNGADQEVQLDESQYPYLQAYYPKSPSTAKKGPSATTKSGSLSEARKLYPLSQYPQLNDAALIKLYKDQHNIILK